MSWLGLDIGGANLKAATASGWTRSMPFALWRNPQALPSAIRELIHVAPPVSGLAITMTGELCDCFCTKAEGVQHILQSVESIAAGRQVAAYLTDGRFVRTATAKESPHLAAASNWRALAEFVRRFVNGRSGLLIDIGSTTTDIIPIESDRVTARGRTDIERLVSGELVYTGVGRTPVCAVVQEFSWQDAIWPVAAEVFATTADAYLLLEKVPEDRDASWTADGRPLTLERARQRLARQMCADTSEVAADHLMRLAAAVSQSQFLQVSAAIAKVTGNLREAPAVVLVSGAGEFLANEAAAAVGLSRGQVRSLGQELGATASRAAPAYAVAVLANEAALTCKAG